MYSVALNDFRDREDTFSFRRLDADFRQYFPLLKEHWVLAFARQAQITDVEDGQVIPYYLLPSLGGANTLRGYSDFRFQDKHMLLLGAEYRWLPSRIVDMAIFVDAGKVAAERRDLDLDGLKTTYGIGIRFHGPTFTPFVSTSRVGMRAFELTLPEAYFLSISRTYAHYSSVENDARDQTAMHSGMAALVSLTVSGQRQKFYNDDPIARVEDTRDASGAQSKSVNLIYDEASNLFGDPGDPDMNRRAMSINTIDEVPDSNWFTNRIMGGAPMSVEDVARGPNTGNGPAPGSGR